MKHTLLKLSLFLAGLQLCGVAIADQKLATTRNCMVCHSIENKVLGPSFKSIAQKYSAADESALTETLASKIRKGGSGVWGSIPMPANPQVSDAESKTLALWILRLK